MLDQYNLFFTARDRQLVATDATPITMVFDAAIR